MYIANRTCGKTRGWVWLAVRTSFLLFFLDLFRKFLEELPALELVTELFVREANLHRTCMVFDVSYSSTLSQKVVSSAHMLGCHSNACKQPCTPLMSFTSGTPIALYGQPDSKRLLGLRLFSLKLVSASQ